MRFLAARLLSLLAFSCSSQSSPSSSAPSGAPPEFLRTESPGWNAWLDGRANAVYHGLAGSDILASLAGPARLGVDAGERLEAKIPLFDASDITRREALWRLAEATGARVRWAAADEPQIYLGLPETEDRRDGPGGVATMTHVEVIDADAYRRLKEEGRIRDEKRFRNALYFAVDDTLCLDQGDGVSAMVLVVRRYKVELPAE